MTKSTAKIEDRDTWKKGDLIINKGQDMIYMLVETCNINSGELGSQRAPKAVCVWSDNEKNKASRPKDHSVARVGEYRSELEINNRNWSRFYGTVTLSQSEIAE